MLEALKELLLFSETWKPLLWATAIIAAIYGLSLLILAVVIVRLPSTYFSESQDRESAAPSRSRTLTSLKAAKNLIGGVLIIIGGFLALPGVPGPGILLVLAGVMVTDFAGKRRFEMWLVHQPGILAMINGLRHRFDKAPVLLVSRTASAIVPQESRGE
jgi:hypothetical protein